MRGVYLIFLRLDERKKIDVGALGEIGFDPGVYVYCGSAWNSAESRVSRHFSDPGNIHWHIDYFSSEADAFDYFILPEKSDHECLMASILSGFCEEIPGFGCSDCECGSHLFRLPENL